MKISAGTILCQAGNKNAQFFTGDFDEPCFYD